MAPREVRVALVVAVAENGAIGKDGGLPWHVSSDLKYFRSLTMGKPVVMGRKTFESIGKPLDGRDNIVITRNRDFKAAGVLVAPGIDEALAIAKQKAGERGSDEIAIIGGAEIFQQAFLLADLIYLTEIHARPDGDTFFPEPDMTKWRETSRERHRAGANDSAGYSIVVLERIK